MLSYFVQLRIAKVKRIHSHGNTSTLTDTRFSHIKRIVRTAHSARNHPASVPRIVIPAIFPVNIIIHIGKRLFCFQKLLPLFHHPQDCRKYKQTACHTEYDTNDRIHNIQISFTGNLPENFSHTDRTGSMFPQARSMPTFFSP